MPTAPGRARLGRTNLDVPVLSLGSGGWSRLGREYGVSVGDPVARAGRAVLERLHAIFGRVESRTGG